MTRGLGSPRPAPGRPVIRRDAGSDLRARREGRGGAVVFSRVVTIAMVPLVLGLAIEIYVVASLVTDPRVAGVGPLLVGLLFALLWFALP